MRLILIFIKTHNNKLSVSCSILISLSFFISCVHNYEPVISSITAIPNPVASGGIVELTCNASDDDESSMLKKDNLDYSWDSAFGQINEASTNSATWYAPEESGDYSITCTVMDQFNGIDIFTIEITVE